MGLCGWIDLDAQVIFESKELSFYQEFFNYWYCQTLTEKLKNDFSSYVWELAETCATLNEFLNKCTKQSEMHEKDLIDPQYIKNGDWLQNDFYQFANFKINQKVGQKMKDFCCDNKYLQYFVLPECYRLAQEKVGSLALYLQCNRKSSLMWALEDYRNSILKAMYESFAETQYASKVQDTLRQRFKRVTNNAVSCFVEGRGYRH